MQTPILIVKFLLVNSIAGAWGHRFLDPAHHLLNYRNQQQSFFDYQKESQQQPIYNKAIESQYIQPSGSSRKIFSEPFITCRLSSSLKRSMHPAIWAMSLLSSFFNIRRISPQRNCFSDYFSFWIGRCKFFLPQYL